MSNLYFARGNLITFEIRFLDADRQPLAPASAALHVSYKVDKVRTTTALAMSPLGDGLFTASWDSSVADPGKIEWHARALGAHPAADDGSFQLLANTANPSQE